MDIPRLNPLTKRCVDNSTQKVFAFSFFCERCGREWRSTPCAFDPGDVEPRAEVLRMLWNGQHKAAYEQANLEAIYSFSLCAECGCRVCMECLRNDEAGTGDICADCLQHKEGFAHD